MLRETLACALTLLPLAAAPDLFIAIRNNDARAVSGLLRGGVDVNGPGPNGATPLMYAALHADTALMKVLLERGANPNARNPLGSTAMMWAAGDPLKVRLLVEHGADVNARANSGRTPLIVASAFAGNAESLRLLLSKGADVKAVEQSGDGPLGTAAAAGDPQMVKMLLAAGANIHERGNRGGALRGVTPLMRAVGANCLECVRLLLAAGADVNAVSADVQTVKAGLQEVGRLTPLLLAAMFGNAGVGRLLLDKGAAVDAREARGLTPLLFAAANEWQKPEIVRLLLERGAKAGMQANDGQSILSWASKWGDQGEIRRLVAEAGGRLDGVLRYEPPKARPARRTASEAVERSVALLQASNAMYFQKSGCVGCHHQMLSGFALEAARDRGLRVDERLAAEQLRVAVAVHQPLRELSLQRVPQGGAPFTDTLFLVSLGAQKHPPDALTDALVHNTAGMQKLDGSWHAMGHRPPLQYSPISATAFAIRALQLYASPGRRAETQRRLARARDCLLTAKPQLTEERVMQILGLHWAGANTAKVRELAGPLIALQRADGGWAQRPEFGSDAYATGTALYALHEARVLPSSDPVYRRGVEYLLRTQYEDGSWHVRSRAVKFQPYFESGFPHEHDQWISAAATAWAATAIALSVEPPASLRANR